MNENALKVYTGYFARLNRYTQNGLVPISIARWTPKWYEGESCIELSPSADLLKRFKDGITTEAEFVTEYTAELNEKNVKEIIEKVARGRSIVLCCYEKTGDFCHRHILASYLRVNCEIEAGEWLDGKMA